MSIGRAASGVRVRRPIAVSIARTNASNATGSSAVVTLAATLRNAGPATPFAGGVSKYDDTASTRACVRRRWSAARIVLCRSPRFEPTPT